jgi:hypothetical protein
MANKQKVGLLSPQGFEHRISTMDVNVTHQLSQASHHAHDRLLENIRRPSPHL